MGSVAHRRLAVGLAALPSVSPNCSPKELISLFQQSSIGLPDVLTWHE
jgi:hypothetical protein